MNAERRFRVPQGVHARKVDEDLVVLDVVRGTYFGLNDVGRDAWAALSNGEAEAQVVRAIIESYDADAATIERDIAALIGELLAKGLLEEISGDGTVKE
jgi:hypothetical protein